MEITNKIKLPVHTNRIYKSWPKW